MTKIDKNWTDNENLSSKYTVYPMFNAYFCRPGRTLAHRSNLLSQRDDNTI